MRAIFQNLPPIGALPWRLIVPRQDKLESAVKNMFAKAGVRIGGGRPWDIQVRNKKFFTRLLADGSLGAGESYMAGWWDCDRIDEMACRVFKANIDRELLAWPMLFDFVRAKLFNLQHKSRAHLNACSHYDIGDELYEKMLDRRMIYSCGYWKNATTLDKAQENKLELSCQKLDLKPGMKLLDIGCGWGGFAKFAAKKYRIQIVGITLSKHQFAAARKRCEGLPVEIRLQDYRDLKSEAFDRIISIGMFEHVGYKNYRRFMEIVQRNLAKEGLFLLHTIGNNLSTTHIDPWVQRYIFPNAMLPSIAQIGAAMEGIFTMEDWHTFGPDYDKTLCAWFENFHQHWGTLRAKYPRYFYRMWKFYLLTCAGAFRAREMQVWQILLSKGRIGSVQSVR